MRTLLLAVLFLICVAAPAQVDRNWLSASEVSPESVTKALNAIAAMPPAEARNEADALRGALDSAPAEGKRAAGLLVGVALERAGDLAGAAAAYRAVPGGSPYGVSGAYRLRIVEKPNRTPKEMEDVYKALAEMPAAEGWHQVSGQWVWTSTRRAAWQALADLRSTHLSFRLFAFLRSKSTFSPPYSYLFAMLVLGIAVKILELPLWIKSVQLAKFTAQLVVVDVIFAIWVLMAMEGFEPQMALDGAKFLWIADVLRRDFGILIGFVLADLLANATMPQPLRSATGANLVVSLIIVAIAWFGGWQAYWVLFCVLLRLVATVMNVALMPFRSA